MRFLGTIAATLLGLAGTRWEAQAALAAIAALAIAVLLIERQLAQAKYNDGVLELTLPKKTVAAAKRLQVH